MSSQYQPPAHPQELPQAQVFESFEDQERMLLPSTLYLAGDPRLLHGTRRVAVVGSRQAAPEALRRAARLARWLVSEGIVVVSGLAAGVDHIAHTTAIQRRGRTIAVIGTPLDRCYPGHHAALQTAIHQRHLLVSQFRPGSRVFPANFVARNRVLTRIAHATVIVDAEETGGSLHQARETLRLGRPLYLLRSLVQRPDLDWPEEYLERGAQVLNEPQELLPRLPAPPQGRRPSRIPPGRRPELAGRSRGADSLAPGRAGSERRRRGQVIPLRRHRRPSSGHSIPPG